MSSKTKILFLCRSVAGVMFVVSAVLKFLSVDSFELFIYGLDWFSLSVSSFLVRALLFVEMFLGVSLILGLYGRWVSRISALLLVFFTIYLVYLAISGKSDNCHCFGDFIEMKPLESLLKNVLLGLLLWLGWNLKDWEANWRPALLSVVAVGSLVFAFVLKAPYGFGNKTVTYSSADFDRLATAHPEVRNDGKQILAFVSTGCKHCKMAARKLDIALHRTDSSDIKVRWFVMGDSVGFRRFLEETEVETLEYNFLPARDFLKITDGKLPLIMLLDGGEVRKTMSNATFSEKDIVEFVKE